MTKRRNGNIFQFFKRETIGNWELTESYNCSPHENFLWFLIYDVGEWNVFVQGLIGFWNSVFANLGHLRHTFLFSFWNTEIYCHFAVSSFRRFVISPFRYFAISCLKHALNRKTFAKIANPSSRLYHLLPPTRDVSHGRTLRNSDHLSLFACKTDRFKKSFFPQLTSTAHILKHT